jgi:hypothetical protein
MIASAILKAIGSDYAPNYAAIVARAAPQEAASIVEAVTRAAFQSTSVTPPGVVESIAVAVANVVPSQVAAIMTATTKFGFNHSVLVASALLQTAPNQTPSILPILQSSFQSRIAELGMPLGEYVNNRVTQQTVQAALSRAAVAVIAIPNPMIPAAAQATTTPTTPVDPSINVSPSS